MIGQMMTLKNCPQFIKSVHDLPRTRALPMRRSDYLQDLPPLNRSGALQWMVRRCFFFGIWSNFVWRTKSIVLHMWPGDGCWGFIPNSCSVAKKIFVQHWISDIVANAERQWRAEEKGKHCLILLFAQRLLWLISMRRTIVLWWE